MPALAIEKENIMAEGCLYPPSLSLKAIGILGNKRVVHFNQDICVLIGTLLPRISLKVNSSSILHILGVTWQLATPGTFTSCKSHDSLRNIRLSS